jgi:hypothetical protein
MPEVFGLPLWLATLIFIEFVVWCVYSGKDEGLPMSAIGALILITVAYAGGKDLLEYLRYNWKFVTTVAFIYLGCGLAWSGLKFYWYGNDVEDAYASIKADWLRSKGKMDTQLVPDELKKEWTQFVSSDNYRDKMKFTHKFQVYQGDERRLLFRNHKQTIAVWLFIGCRACSTPSSPTWDCESRKSSLASTT